MKTNIRYFLITVSLLGGAAMTGADTTAVSQRPSGDYRVVRLELNHGLREDEDDVSSQVVHLAFRDERLVNRWFIGHGWEAMHRQADSVRLTDKGIHGDLNLRMYDVRGRLR
ncbi:MAG: hypothetical protein AAF492_31245, partial [Verrucomicrobiota bacterium]